MKKSWADFALPLGLISIACWWGGNRASRTEPPRTIKLALVQPAIPQLMIWDQNEKTNRLHKLIELSEQAMAAKPHVLVWPEAAMPNFMNRFNMALHNAITNLVTTHGIWMVLGANDIGVRRESGRSPETNLLNSAFLVNPKGDLAARYHKRRLVMLGEYMPLTKWFPFLRKLRPGSGITAGNKPTPFALDSVGARASVLICFEDIFPHLAREHVDADTDFLLNLTNDGWFGEGAAQWQHAISALFRAVENGVPLVRCTNNGLTCWVDRHGRLHEIYFPGTQNIYQAGWKCVTVPLRERGGATVYNRFGDWFGWGCVSLAAFGVLVMIKNHFRKTPRKM